MRIQHVCTRWQLPPTGDDRKRLFAIEDWQIFTLLNQIGTDCYPGQKEPWILRQMNARHFHCVDLFVYAAKCQLERTRDRFLRCLTHAACQSLNANLS